MQQHSFLRIMICLLFSCSIVKLNTVAAGSINLITNFRFATHANTTRIVFEMTDAPNYQLRYLTPLIRLKIQQTKFRTKLLQNSFKHTPSFTITHKQLANDLQIQIRLKTPVDIRHFYLTQPNRLVLDLTMLAVAPQTLSKKTNVLIVPTQVAQLESRIQQQINQIPLLKPAQLITNNLQPPITKGKIIIIDPGHGGKDPGAIGQRGTQEKNITLAVARQLQKQLNKIPGFHAILTRRGDYFLSLRQRLKIAHHYKADLFLSLHADSCYQYRQQRGSSIFALSTRGATTEAARWLAEKENRSDFGQLLAEHDHLIRSILLDLTQADTIKTSLVLGKTILQQLQRTSRLHSHKIEQAGFVILKSPHIPSLLIELGFLSNLQEEAQLNHPVYQKRLAYYLTQGIIQASQGLASSI